MSLDLTRRLVLVLASFGDFQEVGGKGRNSSPEWGRDTEFDAERDASGPVNSSGLRRTTTSSGIVALALSRRRSSSSSMLTPIVPVVATTTTKQAAHHCARCAYREILPPQDGAVPSRKHPPA